MEKEQQQQAVQLCRAGCGFFGSSATEGLCSKCYKDNIKRQQDTTVTAPRLASPASSSSATSGATNVAAAAAAAAAAATEVVEKLRDAVAGASTEMDMMQQDDVTAALPHEVMASVIASNVTVESPRDAVAALQQDSQQLQQPDLDDVQMMPPNATTATESDTAASADSSPVPSNAGPVKKVNRCHQCRKRVGLTGFSCRCGGLFCNEHRYDSAHNCSFDYKTEEREQIRKNNPVVKSDKIQRI